MQFTTTAIAQLAFRLHPAGQNSAEILGQDNKKWACVANFTLSDPRNFGRIKHVQSDGKNTVYVLDNNGYLYALAAKTFEERWKVKLDHEHVVDFEVSPNGKSIAICYNYIKTATKQLDIRNTQNGHTQLRLKQQPDCYEAYYLEDVVENTTLYPHKAVYDKTGNKLAVWYKNHGFDEQKCIARHEEKLVIINPDNGNIYASRNHIPADFSWDRCEQDYAFEFNKDGTELLIGNCRAEINIYSAETLKLIEKHNLVDSIHAIETRLQHSKTTKPQKLPILNIKVQQDGSYMANIGKKGQVYGLSRHLKSIHFLCKLHPYNAMNFDFSPDGTMMMLNADNINLWDIKNTHAILYAETPSAQDAKTVQFHPSKKALIVGTKRKLKIVAPCPISAIEIGDTFTPTGHYVNAETSFSVRGNGTIEWAYDDKIIYHKYAKDDYISTEILGFSNLFNSAHNITEPSQLLIKTNNPGIYTIFGGSKQRWTNKEVLEHLVNWQ